jgi:hypothetical protein
VAEGAEHIARQRKIIASLAGTLTPEELGSPLLACPVGVASHALPKSYFWEAELLRITRNLLI